MSIIPQEDFAAVLDDLDNDGDGKINYQEFISGMKRTMIEPESIKMLKEAFKVLPKLLIANISRGNNSNCRQVFDCNGDGTVSRKYLGVCILRSGQGSREEVEEMLDTLDCDNDGNIRQQSRTSFHKVLMHCQIFIQLSYDVFVWLAMIH